MKLPKHFIFTQIIQDSIWCLYLSKHTVFKIAYGTSKFEIYSLVSS